MISFDAASLVALGGAVGAVITKGFDMFVSRRKNDLDAVNARLSEVNKATAHLTSSLFIHIKTLEEEVAKVKKALVDCDERHAKADEEREQLREEVQYLRTISSGKKH